MTPAQLQGLISEHNAQLGGTPKREAPQEEIYDNPMDLFTLSQMKAG